MSGGIYLFVWEAANFFNLHSLSFQEALDFFLLFPRNAETDSAV